MPERSFTFVDICAGIGGFHAALAALGGQCVYAAEIDTAAAAVYERNWKHNPLNDITADANDTTMNVPEHDVLVAGFPCQPFSKSGAQHGMDDTRGTIYWNILRVIEARRPALVLLENVRNLAGPRHAHEFELIVRTLREQGYLVFDRPVLASPHLLPTEEGGRPQTRERVFIPAIRKTDGASLSGAELSVCATDPAWHPKQWNLSADLPLDVAADSRYDLTDSELLWIAAWDEVVFTLGPLCSTGHLPGFPLWADYWTDDSRTALEEPLPKWKATCIKKNLDFYLQHKEFLDAWLARWNVRTEAFPASRRKLEWQAQDTPSLWETVLHMRPSGIRAKAATYVPALVAITQTSIIGSARRRLTPREAARLQGLPEWFDFGDQSDAATYRQLGNGVNVGVVAAVLRSLAEQESEALRSANADVYEAIISAPLSPDAALCAMRQG